MKCLLACSLAITAGVVSVLSLSAASTTAIIEDFRGDPVTNGWSIAGDASLFAWNATNQNLETTWDSSRTNSYFYKPLGRTLTRLDHFILDFDLRLRDIAIGTTPGKPYTFQVAIGLLNLEQATNGGFLRGTGFDSPNLFEFDYFPDSGFGATISPAVISSNMEFAAEFIIQELTTNDVFRIFMRNDEDDERVVFNITRNGQPYASREFGFGTNFTDFRVDTLAVMSYSDAGQVPDYAGSILAHGTIDNLYLAVGRAPTFEMAFTGRLEDGNWRTEFDTIAGWNYHLYRTANFVSWTLVDSYASTNNERATLTHTNPPGGQQFYRVWANRP